MDHRRKTAADAWTDQVRAARQQIDRLREVEDPPDLYTSWATRFALDPRRTDDPALEVLRSMARAGDTWLDIGAGGGRYALPLALIVGQVIAVEPSASMVAVLRDGIAAHGIDGVEVRSETWPQSAPVRADVALLAHVGYDIESFGGAFLDAVEDAVKRCVVIMRASGATRMGEVLWPLVHGEPRQSYPMLGELLQLLEARDVSPTVTYVDRGSWGYDSRQQLLAAARRLLYLADGSAKDRELERVVAERASERDGQWELDWTPMQDGIVTWDVPRHPR
jgi:SAM-dependent methyltransferase